MKSGRLKNTFLPCLWKMAGTFVWHRLPFFSWKVLFGLSQPSKILFYIFMENHVAFDTFSSKKIICTKQQKKAFMSKNILHFCTILFYVFVENHVAFDTFSSKTIICTEQRKKAFMSKIFLHIFLHHFDVKMVT